MYKTFLSFMLILILGISAFSQPNENIELDVNKAMDSATLLTNLAFLRQNSQNLYDQVEGFCTENQWAILPPFVEWLSLAPECVYFRTLARDFLKVSEFRLKSQLPLLKKNWTAYYNSLANQCVKWKFVVGDSISTAWDDHSPSCEAFRGLSVLYLKSLQ